MTDFDLDDFLPYQLSVLSSRVSAGFSRHYRELYGISVGEWRVVAHLSQEDAVSVREICNRVQLDKPKVSRAATRLEAAGFVKKVANAEDRRLVRLSLTDKGREMVATLTPIAESYDAELDAVLGEEADAFRKQIARLTRHARNVAGALEGPED